MRARLNRSNDQSAGDRQTGGGCRPRSSRAPLLDLREPVLIASAAGWVVECNAAAAAVFGGSSRIIGTPIGALLPFVEAAMAETDPSMAHGVIRHADGHDVYVDVTRSEPHESVTGSVVSYVLHDVTRYVERIRSREQLLFAAAHELRTSLGVVENALDELAAGFTRLSADEIDYLVGMGHVSALHLHGLMEALLSAGAIQSGRFSVNAHPVPVVALIETALTQVAGALAQRGQRVSRDPPAGRTLVLADLRFAGQAIVNLLNNAIKFSPPGATIRICVETDGGQTRIAVTDRGAGIPPEHLEGIFDRFYRASNATNQPGIGLGLAIVRGIAEAHGGAVGIKSTLGVGTTVWFTLPPATAAV